MVLPDRKKKVKEIKVTIFVANVTPHLFYFGIYFHGNAGNDIKFTFAPWLSNSVAEEYKNHIYFERKNCNKKPEYFTFSALTENERGENKNCKAESRCLKSLWIEVI